MARNCVVGSGLLRGPALGLWPTLPGSWARSFPFNPPTLPHASPVSARCAAERAVANLPPPLQTGKLGLPKLFLEAYDMVGGGAVLEVQGPVCCVCMLRRGLSLCLLACGRGRAVVCPPPSRRCLGQGFAPSGPVHLHAQMPPAALRPPLCRTRAGSPASRAWGASTPRPRSSPTCTSWATPARPSR
jgi:hypothetical protein